VLFVFAFAVLGFVFFSSSQEIGCEEHLRNDLFCFKSVSDLFLRIKICYSLEAVEVPDTESPTVRNTRSRDMTDEDFEALPAENIDWEELGSDNRELLRDWSRRKEQEFLDTATQCQHASAVCPIGQDRFFRSYWVFRSVPGLFVEESSLRLPTAEPSQHSDGSPSGEVPTGNLPDDGAATQLQSRWSVYGSAEEVDRLLESLNARGLRELVLRAALVAQRDRLKDWVGQCDLAALSTPCSVGEKDSSSTEENGALVDAVREMVLDLEERIYSASLGSLKVGLLMHTHTHAVLVTAWPGHKVVVSLSYKHLKDKHLKH